MKHCNCLELRTTNEFRFHGGGYLEVTATVNWKKVCRILYWEHIMPVNPAKQSSHPCTYTIPACFTPTDHTKIIGDHRKSDENLQTDGMNYGNGTLLVIIFTALVHNLERLLSPQRQPNTTYKLLGVWSLYLIHPTIRGSGMEILLS